MRAWLKGLIVADIVGGAGLTLLGSLARRLPALDLVNNGLPFVTAGAVALLCLAIAVRHWRLVLATVILAGINVALVIAALPGAAVDAAPGSPCFLRLVTFNLWHHNHHMDKVAKFLAETDADAVVLQEVGKPNAALLRQALQSRYPYSVGDWGHRHSLQASFPRRRTHRPARIPAVDLADGALGTTRGERHEVRAGRHPPRPAVLSGTPAEDVAALIAFATSRTLPLVVAGDFNMSPWTEKLGCFERSSGLKRYNTFHLTWPMQKRSVPLVPLVAIDNVFASPHFTRIDVVPGPRLGSDHRPVTADMALQPGADE